MVQKLGQVVLTLFALASTSVCRYGCFEHEFSSNNPASFPTQRFLNKTLIILKALFLNMLGDHAEIR